MNSDSRAMVGKELRQQRGLLVGGTIFLALPTILATFGYALLTLNDPAAQQWTDGLYEVATTTTERLGDLLLPWIIMAWFGFRVFHREAEQGTLAWLRTMPIPDTTVARAKLFVSACYIGVICALIWMTQLTAALMVGRADLPPGTLVSQAWACLVTVTATVLWYGAGACIGVLWRSRSPGRAYLVFIGGLLLTFVLQVVINWNSFDIGPDGRWQISENRPGLMIDALGLIGLVLGALVVNRIAASMYRSRLAISGS